MNIPYVFKRCNSCGNWLVASKVNFNKHKTCKYGLNSTCKKCKAERDKQYYENNKITLMSGTSLGNTVYGVTPEEFDKTHGSGKLDTTIVGTGTAITTMVKEDPVTVDTKVSVMPIISFDRADEVFLAKIG